MVVVDFLPHTHPAPLSDALGSPDIGVVLDYLTHSTVFLDPDASFDAVPGGMAVSHEVTLLV